MPKFRIVTEILFTVVCPISNRSDFHEKEKFHIAVKTRLSALSSVVIIP